MGRVGKPCLARGRRVPRGAPGECWGSADTSCLALVLPPTSGLLLELRAGGPPAPALGTAARPLPHLCKHPPASRENGPFVPGLAPVPRPSPSAAAPASATVGPGRAIVPAGPWAALAPDTRALGQTAPIHRRGCPCSCPGGPHGLSYGLCSWRVSDKQSGRNCSRAAWPGLPASAHLRPGPRSAAAPVPGRVHRPGCGRPRPARRHRDRGLLPHGR